MNNQHIYILLIIIIGFSSCDLFETNLVQDRSSFIKIYHKNNVNYNSINGDYLVSTNEGFLLGASLYPEANDRLNSQTRVSHLGKIIERKDIPSSLTRYKKIIPSNNNKDFYFLGSSGSQTQADIIRMSLDEIIPTEKLQFDASTSPIDFCILPNNHLMVITKNSFDFPSKLELTYLDENLNIIWEREFAFEDTAFLGLSIIYEEDTGHFLILGKNGAQKLFIMEVNEDGNLINTRFFEEFGFEPVSVPANTSISYEPTLLNMGTHYMVIETGRLYLKEDGSPYSSIYQIDKDLNNITELETNTNFTSVNTVQKLDNEIIINGFLADSTFAIKKLDSNGNLTKWANGEDFVTFDMNIQELENESIFDSSPYLGSFNDFFIPGNIVKATDGGYAMIGTYGVFNGDDFESVVTLFKIRSDGSY